MPKENPIIHLFINRQNTVTIHALKMHTNSDIYPFKMQAMEISPNSSSKTAPMLMHQTSWDANHCMWLQNTVRYTLCFQITVKFWFWFSFCVLDRINVANILIKNRANVNAKDNLGLTPLHSAVLTGNYQNFSLIFFFLKSFKWLNVLLVIEFTATFKIYFIHNLGHANIAKLFLGHGADVNASTNSGNKPLHLAALSGNYQANHFCSKLIMLLLWNSRQWKPCYNLDQRRC